MTVRHVGAATFAERVRRGRILLADGRTLEDAPAPRAPAIAATFTATFTATFEERVRRGRILLTGGHAPGYTQPRKSNGQFDVGEGSHEEQSPEEKKAAANKARAAKAAATRAKNKAAKAQEQAKAAADATVSRMHAGTREGAQAEGKRAARRGAQTPEERAADLRQRLNEHMARRDDLYYQQHDLLAEKARIENDQHSSEMRMGDARHKALIALYHDTLDKSDPEVQKYFKNRDALRKADETQRGLEEEERQVLRKMDQLGTRGQRDTDEYRQAQARLKQIDVAKAKAQKAHDRAWERDWTESPSVYKPEHDSIGGVEAKMNPRVGYKYDKNGRLVEVRQPRFTREQIENHPIVRAERERLAGAAARVAELDAQVRALETPIKDVNTQVKRTMTQLRGVQSTLPANGRLVDTMRPFNDVLPLPEGHQPATPLMLKIDYQMHEPRAVTKKRIINDIADRLKNDAAWQEYVARTPLPDRLGIYHGYIDWHADPRDTKSAALVADWVKKWGVGYRPGSPEWVAMQMAARDEFGLDATIHRDAHELRRGEAYYAKNGAAVRSLMRAMYDNTQAWFADHGITEIEVYRGFTWDEKSSMIPRDIRWGEEGAPNHGVADVELNPFQSFSADINVSQGTTVANKFAGGGFGSGGAYNLLIGAKVPVDRVLSTAQTGFGAKLESEIVVMGRAKDTVAYRAGTRVAKALQRPATERPLGGRAREYALEDGTRVRVRANADGTHTITYHEGPHGKLGGLKVGASKTYKTETGINNTLRAMRIANTYAAPPADE